MTIPSKEEVDTARLQKFLWSVFRPDHGTLWWIADLLWKEAIPYFKPRPDGSHPGLSIAPTQNREESSACPMLLGSSTRKGPLKVQGMNYRQPERVGYFGSILDPGRFSGRDFFRKDENRSQLIRRNLVKLTVNEEAMEELYRFLGNRGIDLKA